MTKTTNAFVATKQSAALTLHSEPYEGPQLTLPRAHRAGNMARPSAVIAALRGKSVNHVVQVDVVLRGPVNRQLQTSLPERKSGSAVQDTAAGNPP